MADDEEETDGDLLLDCDADAPGDSEEGEEEDDAEIDEILVTSVMSDQEEHDYSDLDGISEYGEDELLGNATDAETPSQQNGSDGGGDDDDDKDINIDRDAKDYGAENWKSKKLKGKEINRNKNKSTMND